MKIVKFNAYTLTIFCLFVSYHYGNSNPTDPALDNASLSENIPFNEIAEAIDAPLLPARHRHFLINDDELETSEEQRKSYHLCMKGLNFFKYLCGFTIEQFKKIYTFCSDIISHISQKIIYPSGHSHSRPNIV